MNGRFDGNKSIGKLTEDLRVETLARSGWETILNVKTATGKVLNILEHNAVITKKEMEKARKTRTPTQVNDGRNLYVATWRSLTTAPKQAMEKYSPQIDQDGPSLAEWPWVFSASRLENKDYKLEITSCAQ